ncbi:MAG TPA: hypothetical protein PLZ15_02455 [Melioribacteraceae bacterium]|mgnify:CR=1 FL=1|nr:hypothetical protein [Melioribacteraceae bacterium]
MIKKIKSFYWDLTRFGYTPEKLLSRLQNAGNPKLLINSIPKAGTHLVERAICLIPHYYRILLPTLNNSNIHKYGGYKNVLEKIKNNEILVSHIEYNDEVARLITESKVFNLFVIRDPRDVVISKAHYPLIDKKHRFNSLFRGKDEYNRIELAIVGSKKDGLLSIAEIFNNFYGWLAQSDYVVRFEDIIGSNGGGSLEKQIHTINSLTSKLNVKTDNSFADKIFSDLSPTFRNGKQKTWMLKYDEHLKKLFKNHANQILIDYGYESDANW